MTTWDGLPGADLVAEGLRDLAEHRETIAALLVSIGMPRLRRLGIAIPASAFDDAEHRLYACLSEDDEMTAHSRYNALIRRLVSFERAAECAG